MKGLWKKAALCGLAVLMIVSFMIPAALAEPVVSEWKIPCLNIITGPYAAFGKEIGWAIDLAIEEINAAGGVLGRPMVVEYYDTALDPAKTSAEMSKLVENSLIIWGPMAATTTKAAMPIAIRHNACIITPVCGPDVANQFQPWTVHLVAQYDDMIPKPMKGWIKANPDFKRVVQFTWPLDPTWIDIANAQREAMEAVGIEVLPDVEVTAGIDMGSVVVRAMAKKPDAYAIIVGPVEAGKIVKELDKRGVKDHRRIMIFATADAPPLYEVSGETIEGCYHWDIQNVVSDDPRWQSLLKRYRKDFEGIEWPSIIPAILYDMVYLTAYGMEQTGVTGDPNKLQEERDKLRDYLRNMKDFPGVRFAFDVVDGNSVGPSYLFVLKPGGDRELVEMYPID